MSKAIRHITLALALLSAFGGPYALADDAPEVVVITAQDADCPPAEPVPYDEPVEHELSYADVERLARLPWPTGLYSLTQKEAMMWTAVNRVGVSPYGNTLAEVINTTEYEWYDKRAYVSEENEALARKVLNEWLSEQDGLWIDRLVPQSGVMVRFVGNGSRIQVLDKNGNCVWEAE